MNANCPTCQQQTSFVSVENKKYKCEKCNTVLLKCHKDGCINMVPYWWYWYCPKCVGSGLKDKGAGALTVIGVLSVAAIKILTDSKGKNNE